MTLTRRLVFGFALLAVLLLLLPSLLIGVGLQAYFQNQAVHETHDIVAYLQRRLDQETTVIPSPPLRGENATQRMHRLEDWMTEYLELGKGLQLESAFFVQIHGTDGEGDVATPNLEGAGIPESALGKTAEGSMETRIHGRIPVLLYRTELSQQARPFAEIRVAVSLVEFRALMSKLLSFWLTGVALALSLTALLGWLLARQMLAPLVSLTQEVESMMQSQTLHPLDSEALPPDQIRRLAETFNTLLAQLGELIERQQRFVSDASHELRSPLTAIQGHAELLLKRGRDNPEILAEGLGIIRRESDRLGKLVEDLLLLAQLRHRKPRAENFNLASVARQVVESRQLLHENLRFKGSQAVLMTGDQDALRRIVINLIDNALRFTPADAPIEVEVFRKEHDCYLIVRDHGAGIPAASLPHIFDRFYRIEADRNRRQGGAGLGLPIVRELVEWHQGEIRVESIEQQGTTFTMRFPLSEPNT